MREGPTTHPEPRAVIPLPEGWLGLTKIITLDEVRQAIGLIKRQGRRRRSRPSTPG